MCSTYNADPSGASIFVDLYHPSAINRMQAVENLVNMNKLSTMPFSDDKKNLIVVGIAQRLTDVSPEVVNEVMKFKTEDLIKIVGEQNLIKKLKIIIGDQFMMQKQWQNPISSAIKHITSKHLLSNDNEIEIFLAIWPYMFPLNNIVLPHMKTIMKSNIAGRFPIIKQLQDIKFQDNIDMECVNERLEKAFEKSKKIHEIVQFVKTIPDAEMTQLSAFHIINLLTHSLPKKSDHNLSNGVFDIVTKLSVQFEPMHIDIDQYARDSYSKNQPKSLPFQLIINCMQSIIEKTNFSAIFENVIDFTVSSDVLILMLKLHGKLCNGIFSKSKRASVSYKKAMSQFIRRIIPNSDQQLAFFSNFFINHCIDEREKLSNSLRIDPKLQFQSMRLFNELLKPMDSLNEITMEVFIRIISGLTSPFDAVRVLTCDTIDELYRLLDKSSQYSRFLGSLLDERVKVSLDSEELSVFLFNTKHQRTQLFEFIQRPESTMIVKATLMNMLKLVHDKHETKYLDIVVDVALNILNKVDCSKPVILNLHESIVIYETIIRFNANNISSISTPGNCKTFFEKVLQQSNVYVQTDNKAESISVVAMNLNVFTDFKKFHINQQKFIIDSIVKSATFSKCNNVRSQASKFFRKSIELDAITELDILTEMVQVTSINTTQKEQPEYLPQELLQTSQWKCGVTLLEFLQKKQKQRLKNPLVLMRQLFSVLHKCLSFDDQSQVEYAKQLVLTDILNCCDSMSSTGPFQERDFKIELVIQCVRGTQNPQTHHHALQLLTKLATMTPESVLLHILEIFMFVGSTVVRTDDAYTYQLISNIVKSVVPILKQNNINQVLKVFSDILVDVPNHRLSTLYEDVLTTLGPKEILWKFFAILFETDVRKLDE